MRTDEELLRDAVRCARPNGRAWRPRWVAVMDTFVIGSTYAQELCRRFDLNPDEKVKHR